MHLHTIFCQVFVLCPLWNIVDHLHVGPKISIFADSSFDKEIRRNPKVQDPGCMGIGMLKILANSSLNL